MPSIPTIKERLTKLGVRPSKALGQHFLLDDRPIRVILEEAAVQKGQKVLEIGPGLGVLTEALARAGADVIAVEKDKILARYLTEKFHNWKNVTIVPQDALFFEPSRLGHYKLVANLPYNITAPLLRKFLSADPKPSTIVVMVQKELGERIVAPPGDTNRGVLSVMVQFYGQPKIVGQVSRGQFWPPPAVDSVILRITEIGRRPTDVNPKVFFTVVRSGFSKKRAQIHNALKNSLHLRATVVSHMLQEAKIDAVKRAEVLTLLEWERLARAFESFSKV